MSPGAEREERRLHDPPAFRPAVAEDAAALLALEQRAGVAALAHVFPPDRHPYPAADVLARWHLVLADPDTTVVVVDGTDRLDCVVAYDAFGTLRHLAVDPGSWGRGCGERAVLHAVAAMLAAGAVDLRLWCLAENRRARRLYERLGWEVTGATQTAPWPPYPVEVEYALDRPSRH